AQSERSTQENCTRTHPLARLREVANPAGTPNRRIVICLVVWGWALRTSRWTQERRVWARSARESGADVTCGATVGGPTPLCTSISTRLRTNEVDTGTSMLSSAPVLPEKWLPSDSE